MRWCPVRRRTRLRPFGVQPEHDVDDERADHRRAERVAPISRFADEIVDSGRHAVDTERPPLLSLLRLIGRGEAPGPANIGPADRSDPVLCGVGKR